MNLSKTTYSWALKHLANEGDTDLFPALFEIDAIKSSWTKLVGEFTSIDIENYKWKGGRRFIVPKDILSFRVATQLDPLDSLVLAAIIRKVGHKIERKRIPFKDSQVFSYRFEPMNDGRFYGSTTKWHEFWKSSHDKASKDCCKYVAVTDISDFYNQIYHHVLENQLSGSLPKQAFKAISNFLDSFTHGVSRGIPVGPHSVHLLAEAALITTDNSLLSRGYEFCRYVDDIHIFCPSREAAEIALYDLADILDKQQRLTLQKQKTRVLSAEEFRKLAEDMLVDCPINSEEERLLTVISRHSNDDPYRFISIKALTERDLKAVSKKVLEDLLGVYLTQSEINYPRLGWLLRRLAQVGAPGAIDYILKNISKLIPIFGGVARYIVRSSPNYEGDIKDLGDRLVTAIRLPLVQRSEYLQVVLLDLFSRVPDLDHINKVTAIYPSAPPSVRREIVNAAGASKQGHWLRERKNDFENGDPWFRRGVIAASAFFPGDETEHWIKRARSTMTGLEKVIALWACKGRNIKVGEINLI